MPSVKQIRDMAHLLGVQPLPQMRKPDLIRAVQVAEGNSPCFARIPDCGQDDCLFRAECLRQPAHS